MKKVFRTISLSMVLVALTATFAACNGNNNDDADDAAAAEVIGQFVDHTVAPTYTALALKTEQLADKMADLKTHPTDAGVREACALFLEARAEWEKSEAFLFGAASDWGIDPHIDSWPLDVTAFNTLMNSPEMIARLDGEEGDVVAGENLGNALLGFHGLEYILFSNGSPKAASQIGEKEWVYAAAVSGDLRNRCFQLEVSWLGDEAPAAHVEKVEDLELNTTVGGGDYSYGENLKHAGKAGSTYSSRVVALMALVDGCKTIADEVGTSKIGSAYTGEDVTYIESPYSKMSREDFRNNIVSIFNVYMGGVEGERNTGKSLHSYVKKLNSGLDGRVQSAIQEAMDRIGDMPVFVDNISDPRNGVAMEACQALDAVLSEVNEALSNQ